MQAAILCYGDSSLPTCARRIWGESIGSRGVCCKTTRIIMHIYYCYCQDCPEWDKLSQNPFLAFYQRWPWLCPKYSIYQSLESCASSYELLAFCPFCQPSASFKLRNTWCGVLKRARVPFLHSKSPFVRPLTT